MYFGWIHEQRPFPSRVHSLPGFFSMPRKMSTIPHGLTSHTPLSRNALAVASRQST